MRKPKLLFRLIPLLVLFNGCIYESEVPIDEPSVKVSPKLLFTWEDQNDHSRYKITGLDDYNYSIEVSHPNSKTIDKLQAYASIVDEKTFLNVWDAKKKASRTYQILKFKLLSDSVMAAYPLTENIREKFTSSADLKKFISDNMGNSYFYDKDVIFKRVKTK